MKKLVTLILLFFSTVTFAEEVSRDYVLESLKKIVRTPEFIERSVNAYGLTGPAKQVIKNHFIEIYKSDELIIRIVDEMINARMLENNSKSLQENFAAGRKFGSELVFNLTIKGMSRLEPKDQRVFISFTRLFLDGLTYDQCKNYLVNGGSMTALENSKLEAKVYGVFSQVQLENYFSISRKALFAELRDFPQPKTMNVNEQEIASNAFQKEFLNMLSTTKVSPEVVAAMGDFSAATPKDACDSGKLIFDVLSNMKGFAGDLMIRSFVLNIQ